MIRPMPEPPKVPERWRDIAGPVGHLSPGERNAITDVPGVRVGHSQAASGQRTGVTVVEPPDLPAMAGTAVVNGTGELTSKLEIDETGWMDTPVYLCGTHALGTVYQAAIIASGRGPEDVVIPVVGETDDGDLADSRTIVAEDVRPPPWTRSDEDVAEGTVGGGTGMQLFEFPGGIGTASRRVGDWHVGVLLLSATSATASTSTSSERRLDPPVRRVADDGLVHRGLRDRRAALGAAAQAARAPPAARPRPDGLVRSEGSGEIGMAFSTVPGRHLDNDQLNPIFAAAYESAHEAVMNCLVAAEPAERLDGRCRTRSRSTEPESWQSRRCDSVQRRSSSHCRDRAGVCRCRFDRELARGAA